MKYKSPHTGLDLVSHDVLQAVNASVRAPEAIESPADLAGHLGRDPRARSESRGKQGLHRVSNTASSCLTALLQTFHKANVTTECGA